MRQAGIAASVRSLQGASIAEPMPLNGALGPIGRSGRASVLGSATGKEQRRREREEEEEGRGGEARPDGSSHLRMAVHAVWLDEPARHHLHEAR